ncbi:MAG: hypothetical protein LBJ38_01300, partial [Oscillospiraceae bacterium]|nr:hypothetical protein [Oscillospiraceae bacterium]
MTRFTVVTVSGRVRSLGHIKSFRCCSSNTAPADLLTVEAVVENVAPEFAFIQMHINDRLFFDGIVDEQVVKCRNRNFNLKIT